MCMNCVRVEGLQSAYGRKKILQGITFEAHAGECIGIVGRNGCGKSTHLNILAGIYKPAAGSLFFDEKPGTPENIRKFTALPGAYGDKNAVRITSVVREEQ